MRANGESPHGRHRRIPSNENDTADTDEGPRHISRPNQAYKTPTPSKTVLKEPNTCPIQSAKALHGD